MYLGNSHKIIFSITCSCMITFARIIQSESAQETSQPKMDTQTAGYQNKPLRAVAQTDYTGGLDCLRRRLQHTSHQKVSSSNLYQPVRNMHIVN